MKSFARAVAFMMLLAWWATLSAPVSAQVGKVTIREGQKGDGGYWTTTYGVNPPQALPPERSAVRDRLMQRHVLEEYVDFLSPVRWPHALRLFASDCSGKPGDSTYYSPGNFFINVCYPYVAFAEKATAALAQIQTKVPFWARANQQQLIAGMFVATLLHETGHAAFDIMDVPIFGREEDAADQVSSFIALQFGRDAARTIMRGRLYYWEYEVLVGADPRLQKIDPNNPNYPKDPDAQCALDPFCAYSDEHGTASQRLYNALCIAYGGDPKDFQDFVDAHFLPNDRIGKCAAEYERVKFAFGKTIYPFIDQDKMNAARAKSWFTATEGQEK